MSPEHKAKISVANRGRKFSAEHRAKLRAAKIANPPKHLLRGFTRWTPELRQKIMAGYTPESREKMADAKRGKPGFWKGKKRGVTPDAVKEKLSAALTANAPWRGKSPPHKKRVPYRGVMFRSTYEVRVAKALDALGIEWAYEAHRFTFSNGSSYAPDFFLPLLSAFIEVKGWYNADSKMKVTGFRDEYPEIPLIVMMRPQIEMLESSARVGG